MKTVRDVYKKHLVAMLIGPFIKLIEAFFDLLIPLFMKAIIDLNQYGEPSLIPNKFSQSLGSFIRLFGTSLYYRLERVFNWSKGSGLQLENAMAAIGSAGIYGHGYNQTPIYFPESSTDFIFAVFASNFGLVGVIALLIVIFYLDFQIVLLAKKKIEDTDKYIIAGILGMLVFQQIQNIGMTVGLLPIMGITLPFISYGGSSLLSYMLIVGILFNISMKKDRVYKYR